MSKCKFSILLLAFYLAFFSCRGKQSPSSGEEVYGTDPGLPINNVVSELANYDIPDTLEGAADGQFFNFKFTKGHEGWIHIKIDASEVDKDNSFRFTMDGDSSVLLDSSDSSTYYVYGNLLETMRYIGTGAHEAKIWVTGKPKILNITVRSIPIIMFYLVNFENPAAHDHPPESQMYKFYGWDELIKMGMASSINTIVGEEPYKENYESYAKEWRAKGGRWFINYATSWNAATTEKDIYDKWGKTLEVPWIDGIVYDEFNGNQEQQAWYPVLFDFLETVKNSEVTKDKDVYGFVSCHCDLKELGLDLDNTELIKQFLANGFKVAPECISAEDKYDYLFDYHWDGQVEKTTKPCKEKHLDYVGKSIFGLAGGDHVFGMPRYSINLSPVMDFKVHYERQLNRLVNDSEFNGQGGVVLFWSYDTNPDTLAWIFKLFRHYLIDGKKEMISDNPYKTSHLNNPGFEEGTDNWNLEMADSKSIWVVDADKNSSEGSCIEGSFLNTLGFKKEWGVMVPEECRVLITKRSSKKPNSISQTIKDLTPGQLYSLSVFTLDKNNYSVEKEIPASIRIEGAEVIEEESAKETILFKKDVFGRHLLDENGNKLDYCWTIHYIVFKPQDTTANLSLSDWINPSSYSNEELNQEILWDFIEVNPYYDGE